MSLPIYLDHHSTTPVDRRVLEAMMPYFREQFGNAASRSHAYGWMAEGAVDQARERIADVIGGQANGVVFTSGATEANNLAIQGVASAYASRGRHFVTVATEHKSVIDVFGALEAAGAEVTVLSPEVDGLVTPDQVVAAMTDRTVLVSVMHANNEIGVIQPLAEIGRAIKERDPKCLFHSDAAQSFGKLAIDVEEWQIDLLSISAHKVYGPKGVGALWVRRRPRIALTPLFHGGGHEGGMRSGTLPVPLVVGLGEAGRLAAEERGEEQARIRALRDRLLAGIQKGISGVTVNGSLEHRLAGNLNLSFSGVDGEALLLALAPKIAVSSGAACSSAAREPSYVLGALGYDRQHCSSSIRFGLGRETTADEIEAAISAVVEAVTTLRATHRSVDGV